MSDGHKYTFYGFDGPYWEKKAEREKQDREDDQPAKLDDHGQHRP